MTVRALLIAVCVLSTCGTASAHRSHGTLAEVEWVDGRLEVALQVQMEQLDRARAQLAMKGEEGARRLITEHFVLTKRDGSRAPIKWIGIESKVFVAWLYFEVALDAPLAEYRLRHSLFTGQEAKQVNTVLLKHGARRATIVFTRNRPIAPLGFETAGKGQNED